VRFAKILAFTAALSLVFAAVSSATTILSESATHGHLDLNWVGGFATPNSMYAKTLDDTMPGYANPSGDHTVAVAQNASPDSGGIIVTTTDPGAINSDYVWEANIFTGGGESRRGLVLRATPGNQFESFYMMVIEPGLFQIRFRKIVDGAPTTLASWFATVLPTQSIPVNSWHKLKVIASGNTFRCFFDDFELTTAPVVDGDIASGWVGVYNFRFDLGNIPVYFDDLKLSCVTSTAVDLRLEPRALNLHSCGRWVEAEITPPAPFTVNDIDVSSIRLNGKVAVDTSARVEIEHGGQSIEVKFRRADVLLALTPGDSVTVSVTGLLAGGCFEGTEIVRVRPPHVRHPHHDDHIAAGTPLAIDWDLSSVSSPIVAILSSVNDGLTWNLVANGIANTGSYSWNVPNWPTSSARLAVVEIDSYDPTDPTNYTVTGSVGISDAFAITGVLDVENLGVGFALRSLGNPSTGALRVSFSLPNSKPASLEVFDVTGRQLMSRQVGGEGPGLHEVKLAAWMPPGMYVVRLSQAGRGLTTRITVVR
jgi:hypothetical protein